MPIPTATFPSANDTGPENSNTYTGPNNLEICDRTGFKVPRGTLKKEWNGLMVREESWEQRNAQEFARSVSENQKGSPRPEPTETFIADEDQVTVADLG